MAKKRPKKQLRKGKSKDLETSRGAVKGGAIAGPSTRSITLETTTGDILFKSESGAS
jgi:hypothetical protein